MSSIALLVWVALCASDAEPYAWPLDLPRVITSSFGEYRAGRFHMGIDLRTGSPGKEVHAAGDGYVSRLRVSPYGYGKAVYLHLDDGRTIIYAHLSDFATQLRERVRAEQHARKRYSVDLYAPRGSIPVKKGDVIARSGQTGIGVPHLHYEIRDETGVPVDPYRLGVRWPDSTPPVFRKLLIVPADTGATVNGDIMPQVIKIAAAKSGAYRTAPVRVRGSISFGVDVIDPANGGATRLGIRRLSTMVDDEEIFSVRNERISYAYAEDGLVAYHPYFLKEGRFLLQWRWNGNRSESFAESAGTGIVHVGEEEKEVTIYAEDTHGNTTVLTIPLIPDVSTPERIGGESNRGTGEVKVQDIGNRLIVTAQFSETESEMPILVIETTHIEEHLFTRIDKDTFRVAYAPLPGVREVLLSVAHPRIQDESVPLVIARRNDARRVFDAGSVEVTVEPRSPYDVVFLRVRNVEVPKDSNLRLVGSAVNIWPEQTPLDEPVGLKFRVPMDTPQDDKSAVYRKSKRGWQYLGGTMENGFLSVSARQFGTFAVMRDLRRPSVYSIRPREGSLQKDRRPKIRVTIDDAGSGIAGYTGRANGRWLLMEYDPERKVLEWAQDEDLPLGNINLSFSIRDEAGNLTEKSVDFRVSEH